MRREEHGPVDDALLGRISRRDLVTRLMAAGMSLSAITGLLKATGMGGEGEAAAPVEAASVRVRRGGTLRFAAAPVEAGGGDPVTTAYGGSIRTVQMAGEYLCFPRPDYTLQPKLATSWYATRSDVWTFNLRQG
jgi:ABC-type transport system substrate-binding protein